LPKSKKIAFAALMSYIIIMVKDRYLTKFIIEDLSQKMVFIGGPRQVGKTTLALDLVARHFEKAAHFNWDNRPDRKRIMASDWPGDATLIILDEIHKYKKWKTLVKGEYDKLKGKYKFIITGSARLDIYRQGGDSLQGRYHYYRLHPFTLSEFSDKRGNIEIFKEISMHSQGAYAELTLLDTFGGFPEPLLRQNHRLLRRWHNEKIERLFREDIRDTETVRDIGNMKLLSDLLPDRAGSLLSINSLREDIEVSHRAVSNWLNILESFYYLFRIYPYTGKSIRSIKKEPKLYLWDWSEIEKEGPRFENLIASHLLKTVHFLRDYEGYKTKLYFLRDTIKREVDFLITVNEKPWIAVEAKLSEEIISPHLKYFKERLKIPFAYQVVKKRDIDRFINEIRVVSADRFLCGLI
jgi:predicted AAA+ superfamily ATPase